MSSKSIHLMEPTSRREQLLDALFAQLEGGDFGLQRKFYAGYEIPVVYSVTEKAPLRFVHDPQPAFSIFRPVEECPAFESLWIHSEEAQKVNSRAFYGNLDQTVLLKTMVCTDPSECGTTLFYENVMAPSNKVESLAVTTFFPKSTAEPQACGIRFSVDEFVAFTVQGPGTVVIMGKQRLAFR